MVNVGAAVTVRVALPSAGPALATTRVEPGARAITTPDALISATDVSLTDHANGPVTGWPCAFLARSGEPCNESAKGGGFRTP